MEVNYINPFIEASQNIIGQVAGFQVTLGKVIIKQSPYTAENLVVLIGLTGRIRGTAVFAYRPEVACRVASAMMGGMPVTQLDELSKSAISELSNMILGHAATIFSDRDIKIDISPPTLLVGDNLQFSNDNAKIVSIPLIFDNGDSIHLDVSFAEG